MKQQKKGFVNKINLRLALCKLPKHEGIVLNKAIMAYREAKKLTEGKDVSYKTR